MAKAKSIKLPVDIEAKKDLDEATKSKLIQINQQYSTMSDQNESLSDDKGRLSRLIGSAKKSGEDASAHIAEMKKVSAQIKSLQKQIAELDEEAQELLDSGSGDQKNTEQQKDTPTHFLEQSVKESPDLDSVTIKEVDSKELEESWDKYVKQNPRSCVYHCYEFRPIIEKSFGHNCIYLIAQSGKGETVGVLPAVQLNSKLFGNYIVSVPFFNYGGPLGESRSVEDKLIAALIEHGKQLGVAHIEIRDVFPREGYLQKHSKVSMLRQLPSDKEQFWSDIGAKVRAQINKCKEHSPEVRFGQLDLLDDFYKVFSTNMRDLGTPVYSKSFFETILRQNTISPLISVVYINNKPAAGAFLIGHNDTMEIPWASTLKTMNHTNVNMFMYWGVLSKAIQLGYQFFDYGRSSPDAGTFRFKKQWGAKPLPLYWHYWLAEGDDLPEINPNNPKYRFLIACWKRMPVWVSKIVGPPLVKNLP